MRPRHPPRPGLALLGLLVLGGLSAAPTAARAEEGLFTMRGAGGLATVDPDAPALGGVAQAGFTLGLSDAVAWTATTTYVGHAALDTASFGMGLRVEGALGDWTHPYVLVEPTLLLVFDTPRADPVRADAAGRAALGLDYLIVWGLGLTLEVSGILPVGLSRLPFPRGASAAATAGLYMEF